MINIFQEGSIKNYSFLFCTDRNVALSDQNPGFDVARQSLEHRGNVGTKENATSIQEKQIAFHALRKRPRSVRQAKEGVH